MTREMDVLEGGESEGYRVREVESSSSDFSGRSW